MANNIIASCTSAPCVLVGLPAPVPFKDVVAGDVDAAAQQDRPSALQEYAGAVAALPSNPRLRLRCYQGTWVLEPWVPGIIAIQRWRFAPRPGDVVLASPPKCGTTWLKALAFATMARGAHPPAGHPAHPLLRLNPHDCVPFMEKLEPKDMLVSMWHFARRIQPDLPFSDLFDDACEGSCLSGPIWDHVLGYWNASKASPEAVLFLRYEEMLRDPVGNVTKLSRFVGRPFSPAEEEAGVAMDVVRLCSFEKMKDLEVNRAGSGSGSGSGSPSSPLGGVRGSAFVNSSYFRRGKAGDWVNHMTPEMARRLDAVMEERLRGSGLSFS